MSPDETAELSFSPAVAVDDHTPPTVTGVYMNSPGGSVSVGDRLYFGVAIEDESEIVSATLHFRIEDSIDNYNTVYGRMVSYDADTKISKVSHKKPSCHKRYCSY